MKAKKSLLAVAAAATVINSVPMVVFAQDGTENDPAVQSDDGLTVNEPVTTQEEQTEENVESVKPLWIKFVDKENGEEIDIEDSQTEPKYILDEASFTKVQDGYLKAVYDLSGLTNKYLISFDEADQPENYTLYYNEDTKELTAVFPESADEHNLVVELEVKPAEEPVTEDLNADNGDSAPVEEVDDNSESVETSEQQNVALTINFKYSDNNKPVAQPIVIEVPRENPNTVTGSKKLPSPVGYELTDYSLGYKPEGVDISINDGVLTYSVTNLTGDYNVDVTFYPATVNYTVNYWKQNVENDEYTLADTIDEQGKTNSAVNPDLNKKVFEGFYALNYDKSETIAADGSTVIDIRYDRNYYLLTFDLGGGYGVEPIYAKYGSRIELGQPSRPGYSFANWNEEIPETMPAENKKYTAEWNPEKVSYTVAYWYENANDTGYTYVAQNRIENVDAGSEISSNSHSDDDFQNRDADHFTYNPSKNETITVNGNGSSVLNVYYTRNTYTLDFQVDTSDNYWQEIWDSVKKVTRKYEENTNDIFPVSEEYTGFGWHLRKNNQTERAWTYGFASMPGENRVYRGEKKGSKKVEYSYLVESLPGESYDEILPFNGETRYFKIKRKYDAYVSNGTYLTYDEDFQPIEGFERLTSTPSFSTSSSHPNVESENKFYYTRKSYDVEFFNGNNKVEGRTVKKLYEEALVSSDAFTPQLPEGFEKNAWVFDGWFTTPDFIEGTQVKFDGTEKMPAGNLLLYAKWIPATHNVHFWKDAEQSERHREPVSVQHGATVNEPVEEPKDEYGGKFIGWFYKEDDGTEKAFDLTNSLVTKDVHLYPKHTNDTIVQYTVRYVYKGEDNNEIEIAQPTTGSGLVKNTKTFTAKTGDELNDGYKSGFFPTLRSSSLTLKNGENVLTFYYVPAEKVSYTVEYVDESGKQLRDPKNVETPNAVVTEYSEYIPNYVADAYSKTLVLEAGEGSVNKIIFTYKQDVEHSIVVENHYLDDKGLYFTTADTTAVIGDNYHKDPQSIENYELDYVIVKTQAGKEFPKVDAKDWTADKQYKLTSEGLVFDFHYAGQYKIIFSSDERIVQRAVKPDKENGGYDLTKNIPWTHLYGGLYTDGTFSEPIRSGEHGKSIQPETGKTYYVKEVSNSYLWPMLYSVYNRNSNKIDRTDALTAVDDHNYNCAAATNEHQHTDSDLFENLQIIERKGNADGSDKTILKNSKDLLNVDGLLAGEMIATRSTFKEDGVDTFVLRPYFVTPDGVTVLSRIQRTFTVTNGKFDSITIEPEYFYESGDQITKAPGQSLMSSPVRVRALHTIETSQDPENTEKPDLPDEPVTTVTLKMVIDGTETSMTVEKGNLVNRIDFPEIDGKAFAGWYSDEECNIPADLTNVTENTKIYAKYIPLSEINFDASRKTKRGKNMTTEVSVQFDQDLFSQVSLIADYNGNSQVVTLDKGSAKVGSLFDRLFGTAKTVTEYSGLTELKNVGGRKALTLTATWVTKDGTEVTGPIGKFTVSSLMIR